MASGAPLGGCAAGLPVRVRLPRARRLAPRDVHLPLARGEAVRLRGARGVRLRRPPDPPAPPLKIH